MPYRTWTATDPLWNSLTASQKAAAMALMEANTGPHQMEDAQNVLGAMVNRARVHGVDLGADVSTRAYQPTIEKSQQNRLPAIVKSDEFKQLSTTAQNYWTGAQPVPEKLKGATDFIAPESTMTRLSAQDPNKYRDWGPRGSNWTGYDPKTGTYTNALYRDNSHAFFAPDGPAPIMEASAQPPLLSGGKLGPADANLLYGSLGAPAHDFTNSILSPSAAAPQRSASDILSGIVSGGNTSPASAAEFPPQLLSPNLSPTGAPAAPMPPLGPLPYAPTSGPGSGPPPSPRPSIFDSAPETKPAEGLLKPQAPFQAIPGITSQSPITSVPAPQMPKSTALDTNSAGPPPLAPSLFSPQSMAMLPGLSPTQSAILPTSAPSQAAPAAPAPSEPPKQTIAPPHSLESSTPSSSDKASDKATPGMSPLFPGQPMYNSLAKLLGIKPETSPGLFSQGGLFGAGGPLAGLFGTGVDANGNPLTPDAASLNVIPGMDFGGMDAIDTGGGVSPASSFFGAFN